MSPAVHAALLFLVQPEALHRESNNCCGVPRPKFALRKKRVLTPNTDTVNGTGTGMGAGNALAFTVYGQIPDNAANQAAVPGTYADTITVTVTY